MLDYEIASVYYFVDRVIRAKTYFNEQPEGVVMPCVFYPCPQQSALNHSLSAYATMFTMYVVFMDRKTDQAYEMANAVLHKLMKKKCRISIVDESGLMTDKNIRVNNPDIRRIDEGVYQMKLSWKRYTPFDVEAAIASQEFFINNIPIGG